MTLRVNRLIILFIVAVSTSLLIIACNFPHPPENNLSSSSTRLIKHAFGETYIPKNPQRFVTLQDIYLASAITLGVKPIASTTYGATDGIPFRGVTEEQIEGIELIGDGHQPNLETLVSLNPDLILAREFHQDIYDRLSAIAPTVVVDWNQFDSFKNRFLELAKVLNRTEKAEELLREYHQRVEQFKNIMGDNLDKLEISVIYVYGPITTLRSWNIIYQVIQDTGIKLIPVQEAMANNNADNVNLSIETIPEHDADFLFIVKYPSDNANLILANPIWQNLDAIKSGRYVEISPERWVGSCTTVANFILDDLFKYIAQNPEINY